MSTFDFTLYSESGKDFALTLTDSRYYGQRGESNDATTKGKND
jgi:hypothetical protein